MNWQLETCVEFKPTNRRHGRPRDCPKAQPEKIVQDTTTNSFLLLVVRMLIVAMPGATNSVLVTN